MRKSASPALLSFLRLAEPLLLGQEAFSGEEEFVQRWRSICDSWLVAQNIIEKTSANSKDAALSNVSSEQLDALLKQGQQLTVDGNCHAVCQKLLGLIQAEFTYHLREKQVTPRVVISNSRRADTDDYQLRRGGDSSGVAHRQISSAGGAEGASGNGISNGEAHFAPPLQPHDNNWQEDDGASLVSSVTGADFDQDYAPAPQAMGAPEAGAKHARESKLKKKKSAIKQPPPGLDASTSASMEMLARFAAAREM
jgi:hypothetical protein